MKKIISAIMIFALILMFTACNGGGTPSDTTGSAETEAPVITIGEHDILVSPDGDDSGDGTVEHPLATITAAKEKAKTAPEGADVTVWLRGGRYQMSEQIVFDETDRAGVTYSAYGDEKPVISFGTPIIGWTEGEINGIAAWTAAVPEDMNIAMLSSETAILNMSRYPDEGELRVKWFDNDDIKSEESKTGQSMKSFIIYTDELLDFANKEQIIFMASAPQKPWNVVSSPIESLNMETGLLSLKYRTGYQFIPDTPYFLMNVREAVKNPGEWYFDPSEHRVYYIPQDGEQIDNFVLYAAGGTGDIMSITGVDSLTFRGITFRDSERDDNLSSGGQSCVKRPNAININSTDGVVFDGCEFRCIGRNGVAYDNDNQNGVITNCVFSGIGMGALFVDGTNVQLDDPTLSKNFTITNNLVEYFGFLCHSGPGICVRFVDTADISNNEVHDGNYTGISIGWTWEHGENPTQYISVKDNLVYNIGYGLTWDMAAIYALGEQEGTVISGNVVHDVERVVGIYLDQGSSYMTVENNLVYKAYNAYVISGTAVGVLLRNNIAAYSDVAVNINAMLVEHEHSYEVCNNIFVSNGKQFYGGVLLEMEDYVYEFNDHDNLYYDYSGKAPEEYDIVYFSENPQFADPLFTDPENGDFTLKENSPATAVGFEAWDYSKTGRK